MEIEMRTQESYQAIKRLMVVCDRTLYIILRGCCCDTALNIHAPRGYKRWLL
jgi:hypothetical protein